MSIPRVILALAILPALGGCVAAVAAGVAIGYIKYEKNESYQEFQTDLSSAWTAGLGALEARGLVVEETVERELPEGADAAEVDGSAYWLRVEERAGGVVRIKVRINTFETEENRRQAELLLEEIANRL